MNAIIQAQACIYGAPCYSKNDARSKQRSWKKFIDAFDWNRILSKEAITKNALGRAGIPIKKKG